MDYLIARFEAAYRDDMRAFVEMLRHGTPPLAGIRDGFEAQRMAEAAILSMRTGLPMTITPDWQP